MPDGYTEAEAAIFGPYDAGNGLLLHADPLAAYLDLVHLLDGDPNAAIRAMKGPPGPERHAAIKRVEAAGREVFRMLPFDPQTGGGARLRQVLDVAKAFLLWTFQKKTSGGGAPASPSPESPESCPAPCPTSASSP